MSLLTMGAVIRIINEPTTTSIAYGLDKVSSERSVLIYEPSVCPS